jgi:hypothetical protein
MTKKTNETLIEQAETEIRRLRARLEAIENRLLNCDGAEYLGLYESKQRLINLLSAKRRALAAISIH